MYDTLQKISERQSTNDEYENVVNTYIEASSKCRPTKPRDKCWDLWESIAGEQNQMTWKKSILTEKKLNKPQCASTLDARRTK